MELPNFFPGCQITNFTQHAQTLTVQTISTAHQAACPQCGAISQRVHGYYTRRPKDLSWIAHAVELELHVIRYRCLNPKCPTVTFAERFPTWLPVKAQRTSRLQQAHAQLGLHVSAAGVIGLLNELQIPTSEDTVLRSIKKLALPEHATPRVLGVDEHFVKESGTARSWLISSNTVSLTCCLNAAPKRLLPGWNHILELRL